MAQSRCFSRSVLTWQFAFANPCMDNATVSQSSQMPFQAAPTRRIAGGLHVLSGMQNDWTSRPVSLGNPAGFPGVVPAAKAKNAKHISVRTCGLQRQANAERSYARK